MRHRVGFPRHKATAQAAFACGAVGNSSARNSPLMLGHEKIGLQLTGCASGNFQLPFRISSPGWYIRTV